MQHQLYIDSVQKKYNEKIILSDISLNINTNEIVGILGRNGSGKSTFLKILFGIVDADNKFIKYDGKVVRTLYKVKRAISYLPQEKFLPQNLTVNAIINLSLDKKNANIMLSEIEIQKIKNSKIKNLSGGELKYLEVKLLLSASSDFVILDEPFNGLSPIFIQKISNEIHKAKHNKGIIITDHNFQEIIDLSDKIYLFKNGKSFLINNIDDLRINGYSPN